MQDLFAALKMFQDGAQQYVVGNAMRGAADQMKSINAAEQGEFEKRKQLDALGKDLALQLGSYGAPVSQIQTAASSIMPQQMKGPEDFFSQAMQAGSPEAAKELATAGQAFQKYLAKAPLTTAQSEQMKLGWASLFGAQQAGAAGAGAAAGAQKAKPLEMSEVKNITDLEGDLVGMQGLLSKVQTDPKLVSPGNIAPGIRGFFNPEFDVFQKQVLQRFDAYRQRVTGAGASEGELKILETRQPSIKDTPAQFVANMKASLAIGERLRKRTLENYALSGRDVSQFKTKPVTPYGKKLDKLEPHFKQVEQLSSDLDTLLTEDPNDPRIETLRKSIKAHTQKLGTY